MDASASHVAHLNVAVLRHDWDDPRVAEFVENLDRVNAVAERAPGFVWRMGDAEMEAGQTDPAGAFGGQPRVASTLSVWQTPEQLADFVHRTVHGAFLRRRAAWFEAPDARHFVMWRVPAGHRPGLDEALARLEHLRRHGDSDHAFGWDRLADAGRGPAGQGKSIAAE
jgi:hypothetical protein